MHIQDNTNRVNAGFFVRLAAYLIDIILVGCALMFLRIPMWIVNLFNPDNPFTRPVLFLFSSWDIILYVIGVFYFVAMTYFTGTTVGKRLLNLKVVSANAENLSVINVLYRETIGRYLSSLMCIGYIFIGVDREKRGLHDILCDTRVVYCNAIIIVEDSTPENYPINLETHSQMGNPNITASVDGNLRDSANGNDEIS